MISRKNIFFILIVIVSYSCNQGNSNTKAEDPYADLKLKIIGRWGGDDRIPALEIKKDSIYYYDKNTWYPYFFVKDTFFIKFPERDKATPFGKMTVNNDTLKWFDQEAKMTIYVN